MPGKDRPGHLSRTRNKRSGLKVTRRALYRINEVRSQVKPPGGVQSWFLVVVDVKVVRWW